MRGRLRGEGWLAAGFAPQADYQWRFPRTEQQAASTLERIVSMACAHETVPSPSLLISSSDFGGVCLAAGFAHKLVITGSPSHKQPARAYQLY